MPKMIGGMTALTNAVWAVPYVSDSSPRNLEYHPEYLEEIPPNSLSSEILTSLSCVSWEIFQVSRFWQNLQIPGRILFFSRKSPS